MIKVLVADDHELVRFGIVSVLQDVPDIQVVGEATSGEQAVSMVRKLRPDIVLMDVRMPGIGGLEATRKILACRPRAGVIIVSAYEEEPFPSQFLRMGALGYVTKGASFEEIVDGIRAVHAGRRFISPHVAQAMALQSVRAGDHSPFSQLSSREMQISLMVANCERVQDISSTLNISAKTVNTYRYRIFEKLKIRSDVELALLALRHGVVELPSPD